jgi:hypothetical protein
MEITGGEQPGKLQRDIQGRVQLVSGLNNRTKAATWASGKNEEAEISKTIKMERFGQKRKRQESECG